RNVRPGLETLVAPRALQLWSPVRGEPDALSAAAPAGLGAEHVDQAGCGHEGVTPDHVQNSALAWIEVPASNTALGDTHVQSRYPRVVGSSRRQCRRHVDIGRLRPRG